MKSRFFIKTGIRSGQFFVNSEVKLAEKGEHPHDRFCPLPTFSFLLSSLSDDEVSFVVSCTATSIVCDAIVMSPRPRTDRGTCAQDGNRKR